MTQPAITSSGTVCLRPAQHTDIDAIVALDRAIESAPHWSRAAYAETVRTGDLQRRRCLILAERGGGDILQQACPLVGFAVAVLRGDTAELESVAVAADARRNGIGRALCEAIVAWSREQGAKELTLEVRAANVPAIALYARLGFMEIARRPGYYRDPEDDAVLMRLAAL